MNIQHFICSYCSGSGIVNYSDNPNIILDGWYSCPSCDGYGFIENEFSKKTMERGAKKEGTMC